MYDINIPWQNQNNVFWNDLCALVLEHFGLPGGRYTSHPETDWMTFSFNNEQDYLMCKMMLSEHVTERKTWTLKIDENGVLTFPPTLLAKTGWQEGDVIEWIDCKDGSWQLKKKSV